MADVLSTGKARPKRLTLAEFTLLIRDRGGYLRVLLERLQGHEMTGRQIAGLYRTYLQEGRWR